MKFLALNTSFNNTYVVAKNYETECTKVTDSKLKQSENVLEIVDFCLKNSNLKINDLDAISCVIGPGSFTGIRIGLALTKGFLFACKDVYFVPISSFELMFSEAKKQGITGEITCVINALSGKIFAQTFDKNCKQKTPPQLLEGEQINNLKGTIVGLREESLSFCTNFIEFSVDTLKEITISKIQSKEFTSTIEPLYIRKSQAEDELEKKRRQND